MDFLKGKKTYIVAICGAIVIGLQMAGIIDPTVAENLLKFLGVSAVITMRAGISGE